MKTVGKYIGFVLSATILTLGILGARLQDNVFLFAMLGVIVISVVLVVFGKVDEKQYPLLIFFTCLGLVYQLSLLSNYLVGTDIHYEYYFALQTYNTGHWDPTLGHSYNAATSISVFVPILARLLHIPLEWSFKVFPPLFLSGIPVIAYFILKKEFDSKTAFLSAFFLISVPTMSLELSGLAKQAIGELFFIMCLGLIVYDDVKRQRKWVRYVLIGVMGMLTVVSHYSMGGALFCYLVGAVVLLLVGKMILKMKPNINIGYLSVVVVIIVASGVLFYGNVAQGAALNDIAGSAVSEIVRIIPERATTETVTPTVIVPNPSPLLEDPDSPTRYSHWVYPEPSVAVALGGDFSSSVGVMPKVFRIFQYLTEILIVIGVVSILVNYKKHSLGYLVFLLLSGGLLLLTAFYPGFSPIFNASRFYNLALLFMAPAIVIGGKMILRNYKTVTLAVIIPYFVFTSGAVFELTKVGDVASISVPYSHALSAIRTDSTAVFTENDIKARDWVKNNNVFPVYGDLWGSTAVSEVKTNLGEKASYRMTAEEWEKHTTYVYYFVFADDEVEPREVPDDCYIILRERNTEKRELTYYSGVGMRRTMGFETVGFEEVLKKRTILYQAGNAQVWGPKGVTLCGQ